MVNVKATYGKKILAAVLLINLFVYGIAAFELFHGWRQYEARILVSTQNLARILESNIEGVFGKTDVALLNTTDEIERQLASGSIDRAVISKYLARQGERVPELDSIRIATSDGNILLGAGPAPTGQINISDREYFRQLRDNPKAGLYISRPYQGRISNKWVFSLARRFNRPDGSFAGLVMGNFSVDYFTRLFATVDIGRDSSISLRDQDRGVFARFPDPPGSESSIGKKSRMVQFIDQVQTGKVAGSFTGSVGVDHIKRFYSFRKLPRFSLYLVVGESISANLSEWRKEAEGTASLVLIFTLATILLSKQLQVHWSKEQQVEEELRQANRDLERRVAQRTAELHSVNEEMTVELAERKHAEEALRQSEERLKDAQALAEVGDWLFDLATGAITFSDQLCRMTEIEPMGGSVPLEAVTSTFQGEEADAMRENFRRAVEEGVGWESDRERVLPSGRRVWHRGIARAIKDDTGKVVQIRGVIKDITRFKQAEADLLDIKERWTTLEKCGAVLVINYLDKGETYFSNGLRSLLGYDDDEMDNVLTLDEWHSHLDPDEIASIHAEMRCNVDEVAENTGFQHRVRCKDGSWKWLLVNGSVVNRDQDGRARMSSGTMTDITRIKQMEAELKKLNDNLMQRVEEETNRRIANEGLLTHNAKLAAMGEMVGAIAHQWRQPLATVGVIMQNLQTARKLGKLDEAYLEKAATDATAQISLMSDTIDSFRNFFKPEKAKEQFDVVARIEDATAFIRAQLNSYGIGITLPLKGSSEYSISGFPNEFTQVVLNLLANARDAILEQRQRAGDGSGCIAVTAVLEGGGLVIEVRDSGCGIAPELAERLFEPYFTTKEEGQGTGIGLYMSRQIIEESMGGRLTFTSQPGGTVFRIELPYE
jgi:PAS domain S-box-containing protein